MKNLKLLVVDDDNIVIQALRIGLDKSWHVTGVNSPSEIPNQSFQAAFVDMHLTGNLDKAEGIDVIKKLHAQDPHLEIVAISGDLNRDLMERCLKAGASRFLAKPLNLDEVNLTLDKIEALLLLKGAVQRANAPKVKWIGNSKKSDFIKQQIANLRGETGPILIEGESGTGKEVTAQFIHSQEDDIRPFITVNVAAIPENLFESEFFGHVKGAFTGAEQNKIGLAEAAHGGDLFLDEIEALSLPLQAKLLRFLESGEIKRVGSTECIHVNTRVLVATNRNLDEMAKKEEFREDLLWRLNSKKINLAPLRERREDISELALHFIRQDKTRSKEFEPDAIDALLSYDWPGNVRELKRVCEQLLVSAPLPIIRAIEVLEIIKPQSKVHSMQSIDFSKGLPALLNDHEGLVITQCLKNYKDIDEAAKILQVSRSSLYKKIKDHNIEWRN